MYRWTDRYSMFLNSPERIHTNTHISACLCVTILVNPFRVDSLIADKLTNALI